MDRLEIVALLQNTTDELFDNVPLLEEGLSLGSDFLDSLDLVEVMMAIEPKLGITLQDTDLRGLRTIGDVVDLIRSRLRERTL